MIDWLRKRSHHVKEEMLNEEYLLNFSWQVGLFVLAFLNVYVFCGDLGVPPKGYVFNMLILFLFCHVVAKISELFHLPSLFGMLLAGFIFGNAFPEQKNFPSEVVEDIRGLALMIILIRAGLHLDPRYIRKYAFAVFRVTFIPFTVESLTVALLSYLLFGFNLIWALMIGFVTAAVSPAVIVPCMIRIQHSGLSAGKGLPTLNIAAASIDDILSVTGFSIVLSFAFPRDESLVWRYLRAPVEIVAGIIFGIIVGMVLWYIPQRYNAVQHEKDGEKTTKNHDLSRLFIILMAGFLASFGGKFFDIEGASPLALLVMAFVASIRWSENKWEKQCEKQLKVIWIVFKRFLFGLIGADLDLSTMNGKTVGYAIICIFAGVILKTIVSYFMAYGIKLNKKERWFAAISWLPKATVQAAIGPVALARALQKGDKEEIEKGKIILTVAALSILVTAPIGAILIDYLSRKLLTPSSITNFNNNHSNHHQNININNNYHQKNSVTNLEQYIQHQHLNGHGNHGFRSSTTEKYSNVDLDL